MSKQSGISIHFATSECDKLLAVSKNSQIIGEFLDWLQNNDVVLSKWDVGKYEDTLYPIRQSIESLLAEYFEVDLNKVEKERRALLSGIRASNETGE